MLKAAIVLVVLAIVAAVLGLGEIVDWAMWAAGILFVVALVLAIIHFLTGRTPAV